MKKINIILVGQPNVGKSSLINALCKSNLKVGNFPGVTIEKASAKINYKDYELEFIDLPGTYALDGYSEEEKITQNFIQTQNYDIIINVVDSTNLERNLILSSQLLECQKKIILALNMSDEAEKEGFSIDINALEKLIKTPSVSISSKTKENLNTLLELIIKTHETPFTPFIRAYGEHLEEEIEKIQKHIEKLNLENPYQSPKSYAIALLQNEVRNSTCKELVSESQNKLFEIYQSKDIKEIFKEDLLAFSSGLSKQISKQEPTSKNITKSLDAFFINKYFGIVIFLFLMWVLFQLTFTLGAIPMDYIEMGFEALGNLCKENISNELLASVLADGIIGGVGAVVLFLPNILILFFGIALLETTGYMSRVAFLLDGILYKFGLHGKSFIPLVTGFGCSVPAFMATRTLKNKRDRLLTLFVINFMSCGARLPVYVLFIGAFFGGEQAGNYLFGIYILGAFLGLLAAKFLKMTAFRGIDEPFVMEMPKYRMPNWNLVWQMSLNKAKMYLKKAGTFILLASILIWFASNFPIQTNAPEDEKKAAELQVENSYLGQFGKTIEPIFAPLELDWKLSVSLLSGLAAKEVMISTLGVLYALGEDLDENDENLRQTLASNIPFSTAVAYILFVMIYNPCFAATIVFAKESGKAKYMLYLFLFTCTSAYIVAFIGLHLSKMLT
ncbi:ferrous iron transport protein B [Campylobacter upsaliensis]|uniref:Ferrous iron transport protein B n=1 Tax=Campylobacter upsaliensis TaxID=28080 RepID=A0A5M1DMS3_CAMUP|nr:ferrous iron transport protein B [Campylobacter upsaliensis]EAI2900794.1 ferrous iron transport protein B [Campylobacter upsaliensis]EAI9943915.1 ferrous iron transport protein B [Campylobacter upsaliensis]ECV9718089.1 ferrous iron transport protein B [Campylobacter upsaliensis]EDP6896745.1 ferrous iron transport protein B [Campylobacter upsaliensis]EHV9438678.1 ferrous iron transport protein B [Campylobacter upsaliensis]